MNRSRTQPDTATGQAVRLQVAVGTGRSPYRGRPCPAAFLLESASGQNWKSVPLRRWAAKATGDQRYFRSHLRSRGFPALRSIKTNYLP